MAKACKIQNTYLSTVLKGEHHLNSDQVFAAARFLDLSDEEYNFICLLHEYERSSHQQRRKYLAQKIEDDRQIGLKTDNFLVDKQNVANGTLDIYLNPNAPLVHMFLTVKRYRSSPELVRKTLGLDTQSFEEALKCCEKAGLINLDKGEIKLVVDSIHVPASSPFFPIYRTHLRQKANNFMMTRAKSKHYSFVALYSASEETRSHIQNRFLEFLTWVQSVTQKTEPTHVYQIGFDLLSWSDQ